MQSGLAKLGYAGLLALLLVPMLAAVGVRFATCAYCRKSNRTVAEQTATLSQVVEMEGTLRRAHAAFRAVTESAAQDFSEPDVLGRWLHEIANRQRLTLKNLTLKKDPSANPIAPALTASFCSEAPLPQIILLLHNLQASNRLVVFDAIHMHLGDAGNTPRYVADITLHVYALSGFKPNTDL